MRTSALLLLALAGCTTELTVHEGQLQCESTPDCPRPMICDGVRGACVLPTTNRAPNIDVDDLTVAEGDTAVLVLDISDLDGDALTLETDLPERIPAEAFDLETRTLRWETGFDDAGVYQLVFRVQDDGTPAMSASATAQLTVEETNAPPRFASIGTWRPDDGEPCAFSAVPGIELSLAVIAEDPDGDALTLAASMLPPQAVFEREEGRLRWTPTATQSGSFTTSFSATDPEGLSAEATCLLELQGVNLAPSANAGADRTIDEGDTLSFSGSGIDPEGDTPLSFRWDPGDGGEAVFGADAQYRYRQDGTFFALLTVSDPEGAAGTDAAIVQVRNVAPQPTVEGIADNVQEGARVTFTVRPGDPGELDTHRFDVDWDDDGTFDLIGNEDGELVQRFGDNGVASVRLRVTDSAGASTLLPLDITVNNAAPRPSLTWDGPAVVDEALTLIAAAHDPGWEDTHSFAFDLDGDGSFETAGSQNSATVRFAAAGNFEVGVRALDDDGGAASSSATVQVVAPRWKRLQLTTRPSARRAPTLVLASSSSEDGPPTALLYGGEDATGATLADLWSLDLSSGEESARRPGVTGDLPPAAAEHLAAWHPDEARLILSQVEAGGRSYALLPPTSIGGRSAWRRLNDVDAPAQRSQAAAVWLGGDAGPLLVVGGESGGLLSDELWLGAFPAEGDPLWRQEAADPAPQPARGRAAAFDTRRGEAWFFGGVVADRGDGSPGPSDELWRVSQLSLDTWTQLEDLSGDPAEAGGPNTPPARSGAQLVYDSNRDRLLLFGGVMDGGVYADDLWELDLAAATPRWRGIAATGQPEDTGAVPGGRAFAGAIFDPQSGRLLLASGETDLGVSDELWLLEGGGGAAQIALPAASYVAGADAQDAAQADAQPEARVTLGAYRLDTHEVTNQRYARCVTAGACTPPRSSDTPGRPGYYNDAAFSEHPVVNVDYDQARSYCAWAGRRLPSEAEWERAARGPAGVQCTSAARLAANDGSCNEREFPWGDEQDCSRAQLAVGGDCPSNAAESLAVLAREGDRSPEGVADLAGNVREWTADAYLADYYAGAPPVDRRGPALDAPAERVVRGGSWAADFEAARASTRQALAPESFAPDLGFRCAANTALGGE